MVQCRFCVLGTKIAVLDIEIAVALGTLVEMGEDTVSDVLLRTAVEDSESE